MIRTTDISGCTILIDILSLDLVAYSRDNRKVRIAAQGQAFEMDAKVFDADILPKLDVEESHDSLND